MNDTLLAKTMSKYKNSVPKTYVGNGSKLSMKIVINLVFGFI